jgi:hypothetical protein
MAFSDLGTFSSFRRRPHDFEPVSDGSIMRVSLDIQAAQPFRERIEDQTASAILTNLAQYGSPDPPLVVIHGPSLVRGATKVVGTGYGEPHGHARKVPTGDAPTTREPKAHASCRPGWAASSLFI